MPKVKKITKAAKKSLAGKGRSGVISTSLKAIPQKQTKIGIFSDIAEMTGLTQKEVKMVFLALRQQLERHMKPRGSGEMSIPELGVKIRRIQKKATKARKGRNPFTGEEIMIAPKPARKLIKAVAMKSLKTLVIAD